MGKDYVEKIEELVRQKLEGKSYTEIRAELKESGVSPEEIAMLIKKVDEKVLKEATKTGTPDNSLLFYKAGIVMAVAGLIITIAFKAGVILHYFPPIAVYTPFAAGVIMMFYGRMMQRRQPEKEKKGSGAIRNKRPYK